MSHYQKPGIIWKNASGNETIATHLVADFNGTLAAGGKLVPGVFSRLMSIAKLADVHVLTADTYGTATVMLKDLPVAVVHCMNGEEKRAYVEKLNGSVIAIGNGHNDIAMFRVADLAIGIIGGEGLFAGLLQVSTIIVNDILTALALLDSESRLWATTRP